MLLTFEMKKGAAFDPGDADFFIRAATFSSIVMEIP